MAIPKTSSASTCRPAPSPARPTTPWPSATASATVQRASVHYVDPVHCGRPARKPVADGSSASTPISRPTAGLQVDAELVFGIAVGVAYRGHLGVHVVAPLGLLVQVPPSA